MKSVLASLLLLIFSLPASAQKPPAPEQFPAWTPPTPRLKNWTIFAPKPTKGDNIFKGEAEKWLAEAAVNMEGVSLEPIKDAAVSDYVTKVAQNLVKYSTVPQRPFEFVVLDDSSENAFAIGAGRVYINLGLLQAVENEDQLAAVIAHEIGHDAFQHMPKTITRQMFWMTRNRKVASAAEVEAALSELLDAYSKNDFAAIGERVLGWSRFDELEADKAGFYNMFKAGYNPEEMKNVFRRSVTEQKRQSGDEYAGAYFFTLIFGSHPPSSQRVTALKWESNLIKMPPKQSNHANPAFDAMKARVKNM